MKGIEVTIRHDENRWVLRYGDLTAIDERICRKETGFTIAEVLGFVSDTQSGLDTLAAIEWLARRQNGEPGVSYLSVAQKIASGSDIEIDWDIPTDEGTAEDPE